MESIVSADFKDVHFLFIGDGAQREKIKAIAKSNLLMNVTFLDPIPKEQIPDYLALIDASLVPLKKSDTFKTVIPSKIFEACAMSKPIILGVEGQAKEIIDQYSAGICFEPENKDDFIRAVTTLQSDSNFYEKGSQNALNLAKAFDRKKLAKDMLKVIQSLDAN